MEHFLRQTRWLGTSSAPLKEVVRHRPATKAFPAKEHVWHKKVLGFYGWYYMVASYSNEALNQLKDYQLTFV